MNKLKIMICHGLLAILIVCIISPGRKETADISSFLWISLFIETYYALCVFRKREKAGSYSDILSIVWGLFIIWEVLVSKLDLMHPVLMPALENIFAVFFEDYRIMLTGIVDSMKILIIGVFIGLTLGVILGLIFGWHKGLREVFYPIANVLAPIPSIVFAPYIIAIMPSFRSASVVVILLGIFWPTFLKTIISVDGIDKNIVDLGRSLELSENSMIFEILLPFSLPGIISGLRVTMTTAIMMLTFAEMMGATSGMGYYIVNFNTYGNYSKVIAGIIVVGVVATILSSITEKIQKKCIKWRN